MNIKLEVINKLQNQLSELHQIIKERVYARSITLKKTFVAVKTLEELNVFSREYISENGEAWKQITLDFEKYNNAFSLMIKEIEALFKHDFNNLNIDPPKFDYSKFEQWEKDMTIDNNRIELFLSDHIEIKLAKERKRIVLVDKMLLWLYASLIVLSKIIISCFFGYVASKISSFFLPNFNEFVSSCIFAVISFLSIDNFVSNIANNLFWRILYRQLLKMYLQLNLFVTQISMIIEHKKKDKK